MEFHRLEICPYAPRKSRCNPSGVLRRSSLFFAIFKQSITSIRSITNQRITLPLFFFSSACFA